MKGQTGIETIVVVSVLIIFFTFAFISFITKSSEARFTKNYLEAQKICFKVKNVINQVVSDSYGAAVKFYIPNKLEGLDYTVTVNSNNRLISIEWNGNLFSCSILTSRVTNGVETTFSIGVGNNTAKNVDGDVVIKHVE